MGFHINAVLSSDRSLNLVLQATGRSGLENASSRSGGLITIHSSGCIHFQQRCPNGVGYVAVLFLNFPWTTVHASLSAEKYCRGCESLGTNCGLFTGISKTTKCELQNEPNPTSNPLVYAPSTNKVARVRAGVYIWEAALLLKNISH